MEIKTKGKPVMSFSDEFINVICEPYSVICEIGGWNGYLLTVSAIKKGHTIAGMALKGWHIENADGKRVATKAVTNMAFAKNLFSVITKARKTGELYTEKIG